MTIAALSSAGHASAQNGRLLDRLREAREQRGAEAPGTASRTLQVGDTTRTYVLLDGRRGAGAAPLVIALHGGGGNGETMMKRWSATARAAGFVVAAPNGIGRRDGAGTWNAGGCCGEAVARGVDDVAFVDALIEDLARQGAIDRRRVYVTGFSNGGMMTHRIAIALAPKIAAAAVVSGALFGNETAPRAPVPMMIIHGEKDTRVKYAGGMSDTGLVRRNQTLAFRPVQDAVDFWRRADGCAGAATITTNQAIVTERSLNCRGNAEVVLLRLPEGGHEWPGGRGGESALNATQAIWDFFRSRSR